MACHHPRRALPFEFFGYTPGFWDIHLCQSFLWYMADTADGKSNEALTIPLGLWDLLENGFITCFSRYFLRCEQSWLCHHMMSVGSLPAKSSYAVVVAWRPQLSPLTWRSTYITLNTSSQQGCFCLAVVTHNPYTLWVIYSYILVTTSMHKAHLIISSASNPGKGSHRKYLICP